MLDSDGASDATGEGRFGLDDAEVADAVDGTLGLVSVIFPVEGPCVLLLLLDMVDATDVRREIVGDESISSD